MLIELEVHLGTVRSSHVTNTPKIFDVTLIHALCKRFEELRETRLVVEQCLWIKVLILTPYNDFTCSLA
jgi:hypothetical protein